MTTTLQTEMTTFTGEDRQKMIEQIRPLFIKWNYGTEPSDYIEGLWAKMSFDNLQMALDNFTQLVEDPEESEDSEVELPLSYDHREDLIHTLAYSQLANMDLQSLELFFVEHQIEYYEKNYTDAELLKELGE